MDSRILTNYIDRIFQFALGKTFSEDEAEELTQEILMNAITSMGRLREEEKFEPWLWALAANIARSFRRGKSKQRAMFVYNAPLDLCEEPFEEDSDEELYAILREKIAGLSKIYREIVIFHYYDGLSVKEIAKKLEVPMGTVTWRLSEARNKLKKECRSMLETALKPITMRIDIYGSGNYGKTQPFPDVYIIDALSQNILYHCYESPKGVEELAKLCGVPAYYIEERIENLLDKCAVIQPVKGKYQTDFIIWTDKYGKYCEENARKAIMPIMDRLVEALEKLYARMEEIDIYKAEKSTEELKFLYGVMAFDYLGSKYKEMDYPRIPVNYDGNRWRYIANMESGKYHRTGIGIQCCGNRSDISVSRPEGAYQHLVYAIHGFGWRMMMYDTYVNVCHDILLTGKTGEPGTAAEIIQEGYMKRNEDGELRVLVPAFTIEQKKQFDAIVEELFEPLMKEYVAIVEKFIAGYKKLFPKHLEEDAQRMCQGFFIGFYDTVAEYCIEQGKLAKPCEDWICDVLVQWR